MRNGSTTMGGVSSQCQDFLNASVHNKVLTNWRRAMIKAYREDPFYLESMKSNNNKAFQNYTISDGMMYATTTTGYECLYIPKGHMENGITLREFILSEIHNRG